MRRQEEQRKAQKVPRGEGGKGKRVRTRVHREDEERMVEKVEGEKDGAEGGRRRGRKRGREGKRRQEREHAEEVGKEVQKKALGEEERRRAHACRGNADDGGCMQRKQAKEGRNEGGGCTMRVRMASRGCGQRRAEEGRRIHEEGAWCMQRMHASRGDRQHT